MAPVTDVLIVFGSGGHAKVVIEAVRARTPQREIVLIDDDENAAGELILGAAVLGTRNWLLENLLNVPVALGIGNNEIRASVFKWLTKADRVIETVVHPSAIVGATVDIGEGAFLAAGCVIVADSKIGRAAIINTAASVDHDCHIGEAAHVGPGAHLCGNVRIGQRSLIGVGASACPGVMIGDDVIVGAGSAVISNLNDAGRYVGCPARKIA
jgi:sugar O-acyltransferase (sialic acid O-acetyltransferase NeuD family)